MKKDLIAVMLVGLLAISLMGTALAAEVSPMRDEPTPSVTVNFVPRAEQTEWRYRIVDGQMQMRLWSITENKWLTDWIDM